MIVRRLLFIVFLLSPLPALAQLPPELREELRRADIHAPNFVSGDRSQVDADLAAKAIEGLENVLKADPNNLDALAGLAAVYQKTDRPGKARDYLLKAAELDFSNATAFSQVGAVNWVVRDRRSPQPVAEQHRLIEEAFRYLDRALSIDPDFEEAMAFKNLIYREQARLASDPAEKARLVEEADRWFERALQTRWKKRKAGR